MSLVIYIIICILIIVLLVILTFGVYYDGLAFDCSTYKNPWCHSWYCNAPSDQTSIDKMISVGILESGATAGTPYNVTTQVYLPSLHKCTYDGPVTWIDVITKLPCNNSNNPEGDPNNPNCKSTPIGCMTDNYGSFLTQSEIWGQRS